MPGIFLFGVEFFYFVLFLKFGSTIRSKSDIMAENVILQEGKCIVFLNRRKKHILT